MARKPICGRLAMRWCLKALALVLGKHLPVYVRAWGEEVC
jgi:hypothetical protein